MFEIRYSKQAKKDLDLLKRAKLEQKAKNLIDVIKKNPFETPPPFEKLTGDLKGLFSRRINRIHRLIYKIDYENSAVIIVRMWTHYE